MKGLLLVFVLVVGNVAASTKSEDFFAYPDIVGATLSPNGTNVVALSYQQSSQKIILLDASTGIRKTLFDVASLGEDGSSVGGLYWLDDEHIAAQYTQIKKGVADLLDSKISRKLLIMPVVGANAGSVYSVRTRGWLVNPLRSEAHRFLYAKSGVHSKVYKLDIRKLTLDKKLLGKLDKRDGGQFTKANEIRSVSGYTSRWFFGGDEEGPRASLSYAAAGKVELTAYDEAGVASVLKTWDLNKDSEKAKKEQKDIEKEKFLMPIALADGENSFYCLDLNEETEKSIYKVNFDDGIEELVYMTSSYKIFDLILTDSGGLSGVKVLRDGDIDYEFIDQDKNVSRNGASQKPPGQLFAIVDETIDGNAFLVYRESHNNPGEYFIHDVVSDKFTSIGGQYSKLNGKLSAQLVLGSVAVEGLDIPYILHLPKSRNGPYPLLVMPHGGPVGVFDDAYYDQTTQYFVANGFAVLKVNFRGSGGHSKILEEAGKGEWGGLMLQDILSATHAVTDRKDINSEKVCIAGMSYGGYAATMLLINHPETYACGATLSGVSDMLLHLKSPLATEKQREWLAQQLGDPAINRAMINEISPVFNLEQLQRPLFVYHGGKDNVVDKEHAFRLKMLLERYNKKYSWNYEVDGDHSVGDPVQASALFADLLAFLKNNIE